MKTQAEIALSTDVDEILEWAAAHASILNRHPWEYRFPRVPDKPDVVWLPTSLVYRAVADATACESDEVAAWLHRLARELAGQRGADGRKFPPSSQGDWPRHYIRRLGER